MKNKAAFVMALLMTACAAQQPQTVTVTKTVAVLPPANLYGIDGGCVHADARNSGTVNDLAVTLIQERAAVDVCRGDRAALRNWAATVKAGN